ncbi:hypothetical protein SESBI_09495 [Sesbania bispinosa]|nr:hypothetical protein SESBI_09495 [Sesbania bispinosa]
MALLTMSCHERMWLEWRRRDLPLTTRGRAQTTEGTIVEMVVARASTAGSGRMRTRKHEGRGERDSGRGWEKGRYGMCLGFRKKG